MAFNSIKPRRTAPLLKIFNGPAYPPREEKFEQDRAGSRGKVHAVCHLYRPPNSQIDAVIATNTTRLTVNANDLNRSSITAK